MTSYITFLDKDGKLSDEANARSFVYAEYDDDGDIISEVFGKVG